jgi:hypothetical protein
MTKNNTTDQKTVTLASIGINGLLKLAQLRAAGQGDAFAIHYDAGQWGVTFGPAPKADEIKYHDSLKAALAAALADEPMFAGAPRASAAVT